jgi:septin family protein
LSPNIIKELKDYAKSANIQEILVMRYDYIFKAMVNKKLKNEERIFVCDYFLQVCNNCITGYPINLIKEIKQSLVSK